MNKETSLCTLVWPIELNVGRAYQYFVCFCVTTTWGILLWMLLGFKPGPSQWKENTLATASQLRAELTERKRFKMVVIKESLNSTIVFLFESTVYLLLIRTKLFACAPLSSETRWSDYLFNIWPFAALKICTISPNIAKVGLKICQN